MRRLTLILFACALTVSQVAESHAQYGSRGGTQSGLFGARNIGGGGVQAGSRSFSGANQAPSLQELGDSAGQLTGGERYVRGNRQAGQVVGAANGGNFVGAASGNGQMMGMNRGMGMGTMGMGGMGMGMNRMGMGSMGMGMNRMGMGGMGSMGMGMNRGMGMGMGMQRGMNNRFNQGNFRTNNSQSQPIRTTVEVGFNVPTVNPSAAGQRLTTLLQRSPQIAALTPIEVELSGRTAILRGTVASAAERDLAQRVVLLEPGVSQVKNELVVAGPNNGELPSPALPTE